MIYSPKVWRTSTSWRTLKCFLVSDYISGYPVCSWTSWSAHILGEERWTWTFGMGMALMLPRLKSVKNILVRPLTYWTSVKSQGEKDLESRVYKLLHTPQCFNVIIKEATLTIIFTKHSCVYFFLHQKQNKHITWPGVPKLIAFLPSAEK